MFTRRRLFNKNRTTSCPEAPLRLLLSIFTAADRGNLATLARQVDFLNPLHSSNAFLSAEELVESVRSREEEEHGG